MAFVNRGFAPVHKGHIVILKLHLLGLPRIIEKILKEEIKTRLPQKNKKNKKNIC